MHTVLVIDSVESSISVSIYTAIIFSSTHYNNCLDAYSMTNGLVILCKVSK